MDTNNVNDEDDVVYVGGIHAVTPEHAHDINNVSKPITAEYANSPEDILISCIELRRQKAADYQNPSSSVKQADYYPRGVETIHDILHAKMLRAKSIIETMRNDPDHQPNFEALDDTFRDIINYSAFAASWLRGGIEGQTNKDPLNRV